MTSDDIRISCYLYGGLEIQNASHYDSFLKRSSNTNPACLKCYMRKKKKNNNNNNKKNTQQIQQESSNLEVVKKFELRPSLETLRAGRKQNVSICI